MSFVISSIEIRSMGEPDNLWNIYTIGIVPAKIAP